MATPIFDRLYLPFTDAQAAGYARGRVDTLNDVLKQMRAVSKPARQLTLLIEALEKQRYEVDLREGKK